MSGKIDAAHFLPFVIALSAVAAATDLLVGRIFNWLTLPAVLLGFALAFQVGGLHGLAVSVIGALAGLALYGPLFALGMLGGGDVKLLMALGALGGIGFATEVALLAVLLGGALAALVLVFKGRMDSFLRRLQVAALTWVVRGLKPQLPELDGRMKLPFGVPIGAAAVWIAAADPFTRWGILPW